MTTATVTLKRGVGLPWRSAGEPRGTKTFRVLLVRFDGVGWPEPNVNGRIVLDVLEATDSAGHTNEVSDFSEEYKRLFTPGSWQEANQLPVDRRLAGVRVEIAPDNIEAVA